MSSSNETSFGGVQLLVSRLGFLLKKSDTINEYNNDRKDLDKNITDEAIALIAQCTV